MKSQAQEDPDSSDPDVILTLERRENPKKISQGCREHRLPDSEIALTSLIEGKQRKKQAKGKGVSAWLTDYRMLYHSDCKNRDTAWRNMMRSQNNQLYGYKW